VKPAENGIENIGYFRARRFVYQPLTSIGKDCGCIGKRAVERLSGATEPPLIRIGLH